jgi:hypothetical protein
MAGTQHIVASLALLSYYSDTLAPIVLGRTLSRYVEFIAPQTYKYTLNGHSAPNTAMVSLLSIKKCYKVDQLYKLITLLLISVRMKYHLN